MHMSSSIKWMSLGHRWDVQTWLLWLKWPKPDMTERTLQDIKPVTPWREMLPKFKPSDSKKLHICSANAFRSKLLITNIGNTIHVACSLSFPVSGFHLSSVKTKRCTALKRNKLLFWKLFFIRYYCRSPYPLKKQTQKTDFYSIGTHNTEDIFSTSLPTSFANCF